MCLFEFDQEKHDRITFNDGIAIGREEGRLEGRLEGTIVSLFSVGISKEIISKKIQEQYSLTLEEAQNALNKYLPKIN